MPLHQRFPMGIGALGSATGCSPETIRYYEQQGLLPEPARSAGGHRKYSPEHLRQLKFVLRARDLGFRQSDVKQLVDLADPARTDCHQARRMAEEKLDDVRARILRLERMQRTLEELVDECRSRGERGECPLIDTLLDADDALPRRPA